MLTRGQVRDFRSIDEWLVEQSALVAYMYNGVANFFSPFNARY